MLELEEVHAYYALAHVLRGVSIRAAESRVVALLGRNGAGKTTLVSSVMNVPPAQVKADSIRYNGRDLHGCPPHEVTRLRIGLVPQGRQYLPISHGPGASDHRRAPTAQRDKR
jgi:branched-chain amino acid transport system ATP-binding protein